ncbi:MAG TPA: hypothetical protein VG963_12835, partial [Polyangiaceae bacterium]|nr:hypothetical protein [Polyangiaceae bacterium]
MRSRRAREQDEARDRESDAPPGSITGTTVRSALEAGGLARLRVLAIAMLLLVQAGMVIVALFPADRWLKQLAWGSLLVMLGLFVLSWIRVETRQYIDYRELTRVAVLTCVAVVVANFAFGLLSL